MTMIKQRLQYEYILNVTHTKTSISFQQGKFLLN
jgi:hypothetical protein